jgi:hypothetical protein
VLVIDAQRFRTQERNRDDARERLAEFVRAGLSVPKPRLATRPTRASKQRRLEAKRGRAQASAAAPGNGTVEPNAIHHFANLLSDSPVCPCRPMRRA